MADNAFNIEAAFARVEGLVALTNEKVTSQGKLFEESLVPIKNDIAFLKTENDHCSASRKSMNDGFEAKLKRVEEKIAIDPPTKAALDTERKEDQKRLDKLEDENVERKTREKIIFWAMAAIGTGTIGLLFNSAGHALHLIS